MRVALIVPGFSADESDWCIPALLNFARAAGQRAELEVFTLRYPHRRDTYRIGNVTVHSLGWAQRRGTHSARLWWSAAQVVQARHRAAPFDCLHAFWADEPGWVAAACAQRLGLPLVVSLAGGELSDLPGVAYGLQRHPVQRRLIGWALRRADMVTAGSRYMLGVARAHVQASKLLMLAPLGVDGERFSPAPRGLPPDQGELTAAAEGTQARVVSEHRPAAGEDRATLINVGSLAAVKGQARLLRAMQHVATAWPGARLRIVGEGALRGALQREINALGLAARVTLDGAVTHEQMPELYRSADLFVQASWHEAEGMAVLEAAACGVPATGTPVGVLPELAERGAALAAGEDERALADAVLVLLRDPGRLGAMAGAARTVARDEYGVDDCARQFAEIYGLAVGGK